MAVCVIGNVNHTDLIIMKASSSTPLWLELRKEYIDDNFDQLLTYMKECSSKTQRDSFYETTLSLMRERVTELTQKLSAKPLFQEQDDESVTTFNVRLLATYLLSSPTDSIALQAYVALMSELRLLVPKFSDQIIAITFERLRHETIANIGFGWKEIIDFKDEMFAYHAIRNCQFDKKVSRPLTFEKFGTAVLSADGLFLTHDNKATALKLQTSGANSLDTGIGITLRTISSEKLRQSEASSIAAMDEFVKDFILELWKTQKKNAPEHKLQYTDDDEMIIRVTEIDRNGIIHVETTDSKFEKIAGTIHFSMSNFVYYSSALFSKHLRQGDYMKATLRNAEKKHFDISKQFIGFVTEDCRNEYGYCELNAKLLYKNKASLVWINERGTHMYSRYSDEYQIGDMAVLEITKYCTGNEYGKIQTDIVEPLEVEGEDMIDEEVTKKMTIGDFADSTPVPADIMKREENQEISPTLLRILARLLFGYQKSLYKPSERYCYLANARILAEMTDDILSSSYIKFASSYLRVLVQFAANESLSGITLEPEDEFRDAIDTLVRLSVVQILKEYGRKDNSEVLANTISEYEDTIPILARLARLVQTANSMQGTLSDAAINVIKREIIKTLSLETANDTDLEADGGNYLGIESGTMEFKTSFVYPSGQNMQPNEAAQERNVFRGICAFLNSETGGTLYLGVNDQGYVTGIAQDMKHLHMTSIDTYIRHIQDRAKHYFDTDGIVYLRMEPLYDSRVVAIHVDPHPFRVVELNGVAYLRVNAESREMPEKVRLELISRKVFKDKNKAAAISQLQHACSQQMCVILHNYASSNSQTVKDRYVEAYDVRPDDNLIICYDRSTSGESKVKVFNINRIGWVEITEEKWKFPLSHRKINVDAFHMSGEKPIHISLQLNLMARNLLVEEYPAIKSDITQDRNDSSVWYLNTTVYSIYGIGRFYIGLANAIKILDAPELKEYAQQFAKEHLS